MSSIYGQVYQSTPKHGSIDSEEEGLILTPDLAIELGIQPGERLFRSTFHGTQQSHTILDIVNKISAIREGLLHNQKLERAGIVTQEEIGFNFGDIASLITTNEQLIKALMGSIEAPTAAVSSTVVVDSDLETESGAVNGKVRVRAKKDASTKGKIR
ncbi:hypothetical protein [Candidatus Ichthyocystis sparus]|uniref:hypothetical protein n=1 Tax=Candidatus Ichthyocystis sparus TaxID=1561004 RepID=UPI000B86F5CE|nr:hypothetical protein [Candidatus Ichthyocystis sparus]